MKRKPRVGIERKILTSILWVGILPMAVALIVGYVTMRIKASEAARETLEISVRKTVEGVERDVAARLAMAARLASAPSLIGVLSASSADQAPGAARSVDMAPLAAWMAGQAVIGEDVASVLSLYDSSGRLVYTTDTKTLPDALMPASYPRDALEAQFCDFDILSSPYTGTIIAPVRQDETGDLLGYLTLRSGIDSLVKFALGEAADSSKVQDSYQLVLMLPTGLPMVARLRYDDEGNPSIEAYPAEESLGRRLSEHPDPPGSFLVPDYRLRPEDERQDVLMAFQVLTGLEFGGIDIYLTAYRPTRLLYSQINGMAFAALVGCVLFIAVLCLKAYRDIHNNIVRPVSLLNEGAQIIRQGDFDLKLKIGTGDEIEELASSFNQMAQALSHNIKQLETSEERHRSLVTSMRDGIYQTDADGLITFLNPAGVAILGFDTVDQAISNNLRNMFIEPIDFDPMNTEPELPDAQERSRFWIKRWDDQTICIELSRNPLRDEDGEPIGMEGMMRDITKSVQLEKEARLRSERISAINQIANVINSSLEAGRLYESLVVELKKLVDFDYASVALLSESGNEFGGRQLWPEEEVDSGYTFTLDGQHSYAAWVARERQCLLVEDLEDGSSPFKEQFPDYVRSCLCVPLYATGRIIGTLNLGSRMRSAFSRSSVETLEQMAPHLAVAIRNATLLVNLQLSLEEVTRAREKLYEVNEELKTLDELKTSLLSNVSHELRTPLVSVMGYTDMILNAKAGPINKMQQEYLEISLRNIEKLVTLIENLLDFSRLHRGDERLVFDTFDLVDCARTSMQIVRPLTDGRNIAMELHVPDAPILVDGDKGKMGQVFNNLLSNAVKFNENGGRIDIEMKPTEYDVAVTVRDSGIGIPREALEKVFTRFYQYDASSTRKYGGTGIGLAIAQDIARLHGSSITASSEVGEGAAFHFTLALAVPEERPRGAEVFPVGDDSHILVELVSRDNALSTQVRDVLSPETMDLIYAVNAERAIAAAERHYPDCLLVDVSDLDEDGPVIDALLEDPGTSELPIVLLTNDPDIYERYRSVVSVRIARSFRKSSLLSGIHNALHKSTRVERPIGDKVLCIDDDPEILTFIDRCLSSEGYVLEQCGSGQEAVEKVASGEFGLVLLDVAMPGMDGWETCEKIRANPDIEGIKIYMVTAKPIDRNVRRMRECGADGFLLKPFRPEDLIQLVQGLELRTVAK
ncbi:MAG: response regulator [Candidatus Hydrogenedentes bacterium]|nr:response regulator [Candidatus Hydrogenedentota bacterium]